jgi:hypothetical protein
VREGELEEDGVEEVGVCVELRKGFAEGWFCL